MLYVGGHGGAPKWALMMDLVTFFYQMDDKTTETCMCLAFPNDECPSKVGHWVQQLSYNGVKNRYEYPTSGRFYNINV
eukprot:scaffold65099_cov68-Attheya_sp.AAC.3